MLKCLYSFVLIIILVAGAFAQTKIKVQGYAEKGGKGVKTSALVTYRLMESFPNCVVTVYLTGTTNLATIYSDAGGSSKSNPFVTDTSGYYSFYVDDGIRIDIKFSGTGIAVPFSLSDVFVANGSGSGTGGITSINGDSSSSQIFSTGTSGSNFNIVTSGGIHTFNIPTASTSNRGLLSAADWGIFNAKQSALINSAGLLGAINDPTGIGNAVFSVNPTITNANLINPSLNVATVSSINGLSITSGAGSSLNFGAGINFNVIESGSPVMINRTIAEGAGLAGNIYDLSTNRTLAMGVPSTITVTSTNSVGGTTHTHAINSSSNPGASASILASNNNGYLQLVRLGIGVSPTQALEIAGNFLINSATANLYLKDTLTGFISSNSTIISPQPNNHFRSSNFSSGLVGWDINAGGDAEFNNVTVRGALGTTILKYNEIQATAGTFGVFRSAAKLKANVFVASSVTYGTSTVTIDIVDQDGISHAASNLFLVNDILRLKDGLAGDTWFRISAISDQTTFWRYIAVVMAGSNNVTYNAGMAVVDYGQSGQGFIIETADQTNSPYLQMATHLASFSSIDVSGSLVVTPQLRIGNLNGSYGFASNTFGFAAGTYGVAGKSWIIAEPSIGVRLGNNSTTRIQLAADGSGFLANGNFSWDTSGVATVSGWTVNSTSIQNGTTYIASGLDLPAGQVSWFGRSNVGYQGFSLKDAAGRKIESLVGNSTIYPYLQVHDGTFTRVVLGGLNAVWNSDPVVNSIGLKIWNSSGVKLVEFSDAANTIANWTIAQNKISSTGIDINSGVNAGLAFGATPPTSASTGTGIWLDRTGLYGLLSNVTQIKIDATTGAITAGAGAVVLDSQGISNFTTLGSAPNTTNAYKNIIAGSVSSYFAGWKDTSAGIHGATIRVLPQASTESFLSLETYSFAGQASEINIQPFVNGVAQSFINVSNNWIQLGIPSGSPKVLIAATGSSITSSTALDVQSTTGAFILPRMTTTQRDALTPAEGMLIYNLTIHKHQGFNGTIWNDLY